MATAPRAGRAPRLALATTAAAAMVAFGVPAAAAPAQGQLLHAGGPTAVSESYIVVLEDTADTRADVGAKAHELATRYGGSVARTYRHALRGFEVRLPEAAAKRLAANPAVDYVQQNRTVRIAGTQSPTPSWGLDRIDQRNLPLDNSYTYPNTGSGVTAYIIDTGIRFSHTDFGGRATSGFDAIDGGSADDCNGHGTHVAGTVGGSAHGVAKDVTLIGVRVLDCGGSGTYAQVINGIDWVTGHHVAGQPAVANMSLGGPSDQATNDAVAASIADGVTYGVAAGNDYGDDACNSSPAGTPAAITVGATTNTDARAGYSNIGTCLDIFAPGTAITSAWYTGDTATNTISGTSMATPHVVGAAALVLTANPSYTPQQVRDTLVNDATDGVVTDPGAGSPNKLLYVGNITPPSQDFSVAVSPSAGSVDPGGSVTATVSTSTTVGDPHTVTLSASGLPGGATATFSPASVTSGGSATLTIDVGAGTAPGTYPVTIRGTGPETSHTASYALTVNGPPGCAQTNGTDVAVPDNSTVESTITISGCSAASATSTVEVHIVHTYTGDLTVNLIAPDGSAYLLHNRAGGSADDIHQTYTVDLSGESANGTWRLRVTDHASQDTGRIDTWTLNLEATGGGTGCTGTNGGNVKIPDNTTVESTITISGCSGTASASSTVEVHIVHTYTGDLTVNLIAPDGSAYLLHNRAGGGTDDIHQTYTVNLSTETRNGTWRLRVRDNATWDTGRIDGWTLTL